MAAQIISFALAQICESFGIPMQAFAFSDRMAIWKCTDVASPESSLTILRIIDALRSGDRPGSYPLDAMVTVYDEWNVRSHRTGARQAASNHLSIVISDFIGPQTFDGDRDWSKYDTGHCILISLQTLFQNPDQLISKHIPLEMYRNGIMPRASHSSRIQMFSVDSEKVLPWTGNQPESSPVRRIAQAIARGVVQSGTQVPESQPLTLCPRPPPSDSDGESELAWTPNQHCEVICTSADEIVDFFFQIEASPKFPLLALPSSRKGLSLIDVPEGIESHREWVRQSNARIALPLCRDIASNRKCRVYPFHETQHCFGERTISFLWGIVD
jgi:hypothetical protein